MQDKERRAMRLFEAVGEVDDAMLTPILEARPVKRYKAFTVFMQGVAALLVCATVAVMADRLLSLLPGQSAGGATDQPPPDHMAPNHVSLEALLRENRWEMERVDAQEKINLFTGTPQMICRFEEDGDYYLLPLKNDYLLLDGRMGGELLSPEESVKTALRIWVCDGQGVVASPQLHQSGRSYTFGVLSEFNPELAPSEEVYTYLVMQFV